MDGQLILVISKSMDNNKNPDREESALIRMSANTRKTLKFTESDVEISGKISSKVLKVHQSFSKDIKLVKKSNKYSNSELKRIGFVTTDVFKSLTDVTTKSDNNIWISKTPSTMLIGADPEFLLFDNDNNVVRANNILQKPGKIGSDGAMIEIRPDPTIDPLKLVENMQEIFRNEDLTNSIKDLNWQAAVYYKDNVRDYPVGGHIHLGNPKGITTLTSPAKFFLFSVLNKIMDELLAVPLIKLDGTNLGKSRRSECQMAMGNNGYGYYGEWRSCDGRLEHRTLSGLWLMHPVVAEFVLGTAKAIADEMFGIIDHADYNVDMFKLKGMALQNHKELYSSQFDGWDNIKIAKEMGCVKSSGYMADILNTSKAKSITKPYLTKWYSKMKRMHSYKKYSKYIDGLYTILSMPKKEFNAVGFDIKANWVEGKEFPI